MNRITLISELCVVFTLVFGIQLFCAYMWDSTPRGIIVLLVIFSLSLGYQLCNFLNKFKGE
jgi:hypothetical protein